MPARNAISPANSLVIWRGMWRNSTLLGLVNERDAQNLFVSKIKAPLEIYFVCLGWDQNRALYRMDCAEKSPKKYLFACEGAHWLWLLWELKTTFGRAYINNLHQTLKGSTFSRHSSHFLFCPVHISIASYLGSADKSAEKSATCCCKSLILYLEFGSPCQWFSKNVIHKWPCIAHALSASCCPVSQTGAYLIIVKAFTNCQSNAYHLYQSCKNRYLPLIDFLRAPHLCWFVIVFIEISQCVFTFSKGKSTVVSKILNMHKTKTMHCAYFNICTSLILMWYHGSLCMKNCVDDFKIT